MNTRFFQRTFPSEITVVKSILKEIMDYLSSFFPTLSQEDYFDCKLIYNELLVNSIIHGNKGDNKKSVSITIEIIDQNSISSTIIDEGEGFDYKRILKEMKNKDRLFLERGRGIQLAKSLTNEFRYELYGKQIRFNKRIK